MNALRKAIGLLLLLAFSRTASAVIVPTLPDPGWENGTTAAYTAINYDYGPRIVSSGSNPHVGIDYDIRTGAKAYAVSGQSITAISAAGDNSLIQTGMWRYIHMVIDGPYVQTATYPAGNTVLIFREGNGSGGYNLLKVLGRAGVNYLDDYHDPVSNQDAPVQTAVSQGEWLFVSNSLNHLHLDINNGEENPLKYVKHRDEANPVLWPKYRFFDTSAITDFSDNVLFNHGANPVLLQLGSDVRTDKDLNSVEMLIKPAGGAYASLDKWTYEPYGGYQGYVNTVSGERNTIWLSGDLESIRNSSFEGVYPLEGMNNESFDFFKLQWNTRQKASGTGLALLHSEAKWPDGDYSVKMIAKDATEHEAFTEEQKQVDNFRPFLKMVGIEGSEAKYYKEWTFSGTTLSCDGPLVNKPLGDGDYTITLEFSEPVINPTASIDTYGVLQLIPAGNQKNFSANLSVGGASGIQDGLRTLTVTATDLSGNKILILNPAKKIINPNSELTRDPASGVMQGTGGDDTSVGFKIDRTPPQVSVGLYGPVVGIMNVVNPPLNTQIPVITVNDPTGGISTIDLIYYPPGSPGGVILAPIEYPIPATHYFQQMQLEEGNYMLVAQDAAGNITTVSFYIPPLSLALNVHLDESMLSVNETETHKFTVGIKADVQANFGLRDVTIADDKGTPIVSQSITGAEASVSLSMPGDFSDYDFSTPQHKYYMYVCDQESHCKTKSFVLMRKRAESYADQIQVGQGMGSFVVLKTDSFQTPVIDLTGDGRLIGGGVMPLYIDPAKPDWWQDGASYHYASYGAALQTVQWGDREQVGHVKVTVRTWNNVDKSDIQERIVSDRETFIANSGEVPGAVCPGEEDGEVNNAYCYIEVSTQNIFVPVKRYVQTETTFKKTPRTTLLTPRGWERLPMSSQVGYDLNPGAVIAGPQIYGFTMTLNPGEARGKPIPTGPLVDVPIPDGADMRITNSRDGSILDAYPTPVSAPAGFYNPNGLGGWHLEVSEPNFDQASMKMPYDSSNVPSTKELRLQIFEKKANGTFSALPTEVDTVNKKVSAVVGPVSDLVVAYPAYDNPVSVMSSIVIDGNPEMTFTSEDPTVTQSVYDTSSEGGQSLLSLIAANGGVLASKVYQLGPENQVLKPYGAIAMRYSKAELAAAGIQESSLDIYGFSLDGSSVSVISNSLVNTASSEVLAEVRQLYPLFAIVGSTQVPSPEDITPPVSTLVSPVGYIAGNNTYIPQNGLFEITAADQNTAGAPVSNAASSYYLIDAEPGTVAPIIYTGPFTLPEGIHSIKYRSGDNAGNMEVWNTRTFYVDGNPPETQIAVINSTAPMVGTVYITERDSITLMAIDPVSNGVTSEVRNRYFLVDTTPETCQFVPEFTGPAGTCQNPKYSTPFALSTGPHTVYYASDDNVGNMAVIKSVNFSVAATPPPAGFSATDPMNTVRFAHTMTLLPNGKVLITGGRNSNGYLSSAELYDPATRTFSATGSMSSARAFHAAALLPGGKVLIIGGHTGGPALSSAELYDPLTGLFSATGSMISGREAFTAILLANGKVLAAGGYNGPAILSSAELYDPATRTFTATGSMSAARGHAALILLSNGKALAAGGNAGSAPLSSAELYDPATGNFTATGSMNAARWRFGETLLANGKVLVVGGAGNGGANLSSAELYDPATGAFAAAGSMSTVRAEAITALLPNGKVLVAGGYSTITLSSAELYDSVLGTFSTTGSMSVGRGGHVAALLTDGKVLVTGGTGTTSSEVYDSGVSVQAKTVLASIAVTPSSAAIAVGGTQQFTATGNFSDGSSRALGATDGLVWSTDNSAVATVGPDGLATGVGDGTAHITVSSGIISAEASLVVGVIPPAAGFSLTGPMTAVRIIHTETLLQDGRMLITGGNNSGGSLSSAELYSPVSRTFAATGPMHAARVRHTATLLPNGKVLIAGGGNLSSAELYDPSTGLFTYTGSMNAAKEDHTATLLPNGKVLIAGGYAGGSVLSSAELYDPANGTFTPINSMIVRRTNHTATLLTNGKVLLAGGHGNISSAELYDPVTGLFTNTGPMSAVRGYQAAALLPNGKVLLVGGLGAGYSYSASADLYDPVAGTFAATGSMSTVRHRHVAVLLPNGKVLVAGGNNSVESLSSVELYDPASGIFTTTDSMSIGRSEHAGALLRDGKVLIAGGAGTPSAEVYDPGFSGPVSIVLTSIVVTPASATVEVGGTQQFTATGNFSDGSNRALGTADGLVWSVDTDAIATIGLDGLATGITDGTAHITVSSGIINAEARLVVGVIPPPAGFSATGSMITNRGTHTETLLLNGKVLITGGRGSSGYLSSSELYDPVTKTFTATGSMATAKSYHAATLLPNGKVLITGGFNGSTAFSSAELYDPAAGTFSATGSMLAERDVHTATLLQNGKVLIAGGENEKGTTHASAEIYDPATGAFTATGSMSAPREQCAATLLPNGKVLMAGGYNGSVPLSSADLYDPVTGTFTATGSMSASRWRYTKSILPNGKVLIIGGVSDGNVYLSAAELYDPATGAFTATGSMSTVRGGATATLLPTGKVLVAGGNTSAGSLSSAELYDPANGAFTATSSMSVARGAHSATLLNNGKVLVAGGHDGISFVSSGEIYDSGLSSSFAMTANPGTITPTQNFTTVEYVLPVPGYVTLEVLSSTAPYSRLRSIHNAVFQAAGHQSAQWDGKGVNASVLGDGAYILRLMVVGVSGNFSASTERTVFIDNYPQLQSIVAKPASFNPPSGERTRFVFSVSEDVILNVAVKDLSGGLIKDLAVNAPSPAGSLNFYWDGRDNSGQLVPPGNYHITVNAVDRTGNRAEASGGNCEVLSPSYPAITGLSETPDPFDARIAGSAVTFSYHLAAVSQTSTVFPVTITISHPLLGIVKTMTLQQEQGDRSVLWDGVSDPGSPLNGLAAPDGAYSEEVSVNVDGQIASAYGAFSLLRNNVYSAQSSGSEPTVTVQYDDPVAQISITQDPPITSTVSAALLSQTLSGNVLASPIFDIVASQAFTTQPVLRFKYDPVFDGESLALYKYSVLSGTWIQVSTSYYVDLANNEIIITLNPDVFMGSLFALMKSDDTLPPVTGLVFTGSRYAAGGNQYISGQTMIGLRAQDQGGSGVSYIEYRTDGGAFASYTAPFTLPAGAHVIEYRSADNAGNIEDVKTSNITVDNMAPESTVSMVGISGRNGWYLTGVDAAISASDAHAGVKETLYRLDGGSFAVYASSFAVLSEGRHALEVYSIDNVSNVEISTTIGFGIDTAAPVSTAVISGTNKNGWYSSAVTLDLASMDGISGVKDIKWSLDGSGYASYTEPIVVSSEGKHVVSYYAEDMAGNTELSKPIEFSMNSSAPLVDYLLSPLPNLDGWNNGPVNVMFRASDTLSGIEECSSITVTTEGKDQKIAGWCRDLAGNVGYSTATLNIDSTEPGINISSPVAGALFMAGRDKIEIRLVVEDNLDPAPAVMAVVTQIADKGTPRGEGPGSVVVVNGQLIDPLELDDGLWRLEVSARDIAGNSTQAVSGPFEVAHDTMPPQTSLSVGVPNFVSGGSTFITSHTPLLFSAADDMLIAGDRSGVGVAATYIYLDSRLVDVLSSPFFVPGENVHAVDYYSVDRASNTETAHSASFTVDNSSPVSSIAFSGAASAGADGGYSVPSGSSVSFTAADMPAVASGVSDIWYSVDSGAASVFDSAFALAVGTHTVIYWSVDNLGNTEAGKTALVSVGEAAWAVKLNLEPSTLNLKSKGESVTAKLRFEGSGQACFKPKTLKISAINGLELNNPIFAQSSKAKDDDDSRCGPITVKFDREALIAVLPANAVSNITVSGALTDGRGFSASDTIKTIKPRKTTRKDGGRLENERRAGFDAPAGALRHDDDLYVLSVEGDYGSSESVKDAAAKARGIARRGIAYEFGPTGTIFDKPVTISLPCDVDDRSSEKLAVAYWNEAAGLWELLPSRRDTAARQIKADVPHFSQYQVVLASYAVSSQETVRRVRASEQGEFSVSAADAEFKLGEVYVYPNPAKGGKVPTFHVEVGIADIVKIRVYTVAGQLVHERSLAGTPQTIGSVYAYEYAWAGHIASGVYYYTIEAEKTGKKLKAKGKFAVVR